MPGPIICDGGRPTVWPKPQDLSLAQRNPLGVGVCLLLQELEVGGWPLRIWLNWIENWQPHRSREGILGGRGGILMMQSEVANW